MPHLIKWSGKRDSNPRPQPWQGCALPLSYSRNTVTAAADCNKRPRRVSTYGPSGTSPAEVLRRLLGRRRVDEEARCPTRSRPPCVSFGMISRCQWKWSRAGVRRGALCSMKLYGGSPRQLLHAAAGPRRGVWPARASSSAGVLLEARPVGRGQDPGLEGKARREGRERHEAALLQHRAGPPSRRSCRTMSHQMQRSLIRKCWTAPASSSLHHDRARWAWRSAGSGGARARRPPPRRGS